MHAIENRFPYRENNSAENGDNRLGNMVVHGNVMSRSDCFPFDTVAAAIEKVISARHRDLLDINMKMLEAGYKYES